MATITREVEVYAEDFDDEELLSELESRGYYAGKQALDAPCVNDLYDAWVYKLGNFEELFREFCRVNIGRSF